MSRQKRITKIAIFAALIILGTCTQVIPVCAATDTSAVTTQFDKLQTLVASIVSGIGTIIALWAISEFGLALQGNEGGMQAHSFKRIGGALIMVLAPQILTILT